MTTTVTDGILEVQNNGSIGTGAITVAGPSTFIAAGAMTALPPITNSGTFTVSTTGALTGTTITNNIGATINVTAANLTGTTITNNGTINVSATRTLTATTSTPGTGSAAINGTLPLIAGTTNNWAFSGAGDITAADDLTLGGSSNGFTGTITPLADATTITAKQATSLGSGLFDFTSRAGVTVTYDATTPNGTVATKFNTGADNTNIINFDTPNALTVTGDSSTFNGTVNVNDGAVFLSGAKIGTLMDRELAMNVAANTTLNLTNGAEVYSFTSNLGAGSILRFDLTGGAAPIFDAATLVAHDTSVLDIQLEAVPATGYLNFFVMNMHTKPLLSINTGFIAEWDGFRIKITEDSNNPAPSPNVSPATAKFDGNTPADLSFLLRGSALTAANNETLTLSIDGVKLGSSSYAIDAPNLTLSASFLKTLADGNHTITLMNGTSNVGKITLTITNGGSGIVDGGGSSGCNTGAVLPMALMLLAPLALFRKKD